MYKTWATFNCKCSKTLPAITQAAFCGSGFYTGGCRSRSSYRLVSCSRLEYSHMLEDLSGMMSQKNKKKHAHQWAGRNVWQCEAKCSRYRLWRFQARLKLSDALSYTWTREDGESAASTFVIWYHGATCTTSWIVVYQPLDASFNINISNSDDMVIGIA